MPALGAILTAIITPFDADGRVDEDAFVAVQQHVCATGSDGVVVAGTTGEAPTLSDEEHLRIIELAVANRPAPSTFPTLGRIGGIWSIPDTSPFATDGTAPSSTTK